MLVPGMCSGIVIGVRAQEGMVYGYEDGDGERTSASAKADSKLSGP